MTDILTVLAVTAVTGLATGLGALPVFFRASVSHRTYDASLGLAAGIMIAASVFALIIPGMDEGGLGTVIAGVFVGGLGLLAANRLVPHVHAWYQSREGHGGADLDAFASETPHVTDSADRERDSRLRRAVLVGTAITLHNAPEGLAMGVAFASGLENVAFVLAVVIGLQNVPDGFAFAVPASDTGMGNGRVLLWTTLSGAVPQVVMAVFGFYLVTIATGLFPIAAGFAAGAMMAVVFREMIPSSHGHGHADAATGAFLVGFVLLVVVDTVL
ncbi:MAG: ZIP family metal transporter [Haloferacaceae archaeon]